MPGNLEAPPVTSPSIGGGIEGAMGTMGPAVGSEGSIVKGLEGTMGGVPPTLNPELSSLTTDLDTKAHVDPHAGLADLAGLDKPSAPPVADLDLSKVAPPVEQREDKPAAGVDIDQAAKIGADSPDALTPAAGAVDDKVNVVGDKAKTDQADTGEPAPATTEKVEADTGAATPQAKVEAPTDTKPPEATSSTLSAEDQARQKELVERNSRGELNKAEQGELIELNKKDQNGREIQTYNTLQQRIDKGETLSPAEQAEHARLIEKHQVEIDKTKSVDQFKKEADALGEKMTKDLASGNEPSPEDLKRYQELRIQQSLRGNGITAEDASEIIKNLGNLEARGLKARRETLLQADIKEKLKELMTLEYQMLAVPQRLKALREQREKVKGQIKQQDTTANFILGDPASPENYQKRMQMYPLYMQLANIKGEVGRIKYAGTVLKAQYKDTMAYVRRKLGVSSPIGAVLEFIDAKAEGFQAEITLELGSLLDSE